MSVERVIRAVAYRVRRMRRRLAERRKSKRLPEWFKDAEPNFSRHLSTLAGQSNLHFLQIGVFTGDASVWLLEHVLTGPGCRLDDVDPWTGAPDHEGMRIDWTAIQAMYAERTRSYQAIVTNWAMRSDQFFAETPPTPCYDFAYIDGDHTAQAVLHDAMGAWERMKPGGVMAFDDYEWGETRPDHDRPKPAIDTFLNAHSEELVVIESGWQLWVRKREDSLHSSMTR